MKEFFQILQFDKQEMLSLFKRKQKELFSKDSNWYLKLQLARLNISNVTEGQIIIIDEIGKLIKSKKFMFRYVDRSKKQVVSLSKFNLEAIVEQIKLCSQEKYAIVTFDSKNSQSTARLLQNQTESQNGYFEHPVIEFNQISLTKRREIVNTIQKKLAQDMKLKFRFYIWVKEKQDYKKNLQKILKIFSTEMLKNTLFIVVLPQQGTIEDLSDIQEELDQYLKNIDSEYLPNILFQSQNELIKQPKQLDLITQFILSEVNTYDLMLVQRHKDQLQNLIQEKKNALVSLNTNKNQKNVMVEKLQEQQKKIYAFYSEMIQFEKNGYKKPKLLLIVNQGDEVIQLYLLAQKIKKHKKVIVRVELLRKKVEEEESKNNQLNIQEKELKLPNQVKKYLLGNKLVQQGSLEDTFIKFYEIYIPQSPKIYQLKSLLSIIQERKQNYFTYGQLSRFIYLILNQVLQLKQYNQMAYLTCCSILTREDLSEVWFLYQPLNLELASSQNYQILEARKQNNQYLPQQFLEEMLKKKDKIAFETFFYSQLLMILKNLILLREDERQLQIRKEVMIEEIFKHIDLINETQRQELKYDKLKQVFAFKDSGMKIITDLEQFVSNFCSLEETLDQQQKNQLNLLVQKCRTTVEEKKQSSSQLSTKKFYLTRKQNYAFGTNQATIKYNQEVQRHTSSQNSGNQLKQEQQTEEENIQQREKSLECFKQEEILRKTQIYLKDSKRSIKKLIKGLIIELFDKEEWLNQNQKEFQQLIKMNPNIANLDEKRYKQCKMNIMYSYLNHQAKQYQLNSLQITVLAIVLQEEIFQQQKEKNQTLTIAFDVFQRLQSHDYQIFREIQVQQNQHEKKDSKKVQEINQKYKKLIELSKKNKGQHFFKTDLETLKVAKLLEIMYLANETTSEASFYGISQKTKSITPQISQRDRDISSLLKEKIALIPKKQEEDLIQFSRQNGQQTSQGQLNVLLQKTGIFFNDRENLNH